MTNITALLLVLTLTGSPAISAACFTWCQQGPVTYGHCHDDMAAGSGPEITGDLTCGEPSLVDSPYLVEHRTATGAAVLTTTSPVAMALAVRTKAPAVIVALVSAVPRPPLVLRV
jgi:hypothetical protein